jgi:hypothetical protein
VAFVKIGVVNGLPAVPAVAVFELYQTGEPPTQLAVKDAVKPEQIIVPAAVGGVTAGFTVISTCVLALGQTGLVLSQSTK